MATESQARRLAIKHGAHLKKSRRAVSGDNFGDFMLVDDQTNVVLAQSEKFDLTPDDVLAYFKETEKTSV